MEMCSNATNARASALQSPAGFMPRCKGASKFAAVDVPKDADLLMPCQAVLKIQLREKCHYLIPPSLTEPSWPEETLSCHFCLLIAVNHAGITTAMPPEWGQPQKHTFSA